MSGFYWFWPNIYGCWHNDCFKLFALLGHVFGRKWRGHWNRRNVSITALAFLYKTHQIEWSIHLSYRNVSVLDFDTYEIIIQSFSFAVVLYTKLPNRNIGCLALFSCCWNIHAQTGGARALLIEIHFVISSASIVRKMMDEKFKYLNTMRCYAMRCVRCKHRSISHVS